MVIFKCKMCGGNLEIDEQMVVGTCRHCGSTMTLPKVSEEKVTSLFNRANHYRRNSEFDKAIKVYENILNEDNLNAEAYWGLVLCKYGIEYVEDPATGQRIPTCHRAQKTSIFLDVDYKQALEYADAPARQIYEAEAVAIDAIQKQILAISAQEAPYDIFICYKETSATGSRTKDSVLAQDIYHHLTEAGYKVFFSRISLEDKLGTAYEPYIFAALNSSPVMIVVATNTESVSAVWTKNEWSRYLALINKGEKKVLIPVYRDMDPYDLPEEFAHFQAQDIGRLGFMQDLVRGVKKIFDAGAKAEQINVARQASSVGASTESLLKRAFICLEDGEWSKADELLERALDMDPENAKAYIGKLLVDYEVFNVAELKELTEPIDNNNNYKKAIRFGDDPIKKGLAQYNSVIVERANNPDILIEKAFTLLNNSNWEGADRILDSVLSIDSKNAKAYVGKLMAKYHVKEEAGLSKIDEPLDEDICYQNAVMYAGGSYKETIINYNKAIYEHVKKQNMKIAFHHLSTGNWEGADRILDSVLSIDSKNAKAYVGKLMAKYHVKEEAGLSKIDEPLDDDIYYQKAVMYASDS